MFRNVIFNLVLVVFTFNTAQAKANADFSSVPLAQLFSNYDKYLKIKKKDKLNFKPVYILQSKTVSPDEVVLSFSYDGQDYALKPKSDGYIAFYPTKQMLDANPMVATNQPKGTLSVEISLQLTPVLSNEYTIDNLHNTTHKAWGVAKKFAGAMRFFAPKHNFITAIFSDVCGDASWQINKGEKVVLKGDGLSGAVIDFSKKEIRNAEKIKFNCTPDRFKLGS
jgi:hypothetical protein